MSTRFAATFVLVVALAMGSGIGTAQAAQHPPTVFAITALTPNPTTAVANGPIRTLKTTWTGAPTFPVTEFLAPTTHCAPAGFSCNPGQITFTKDKNPLIWKSAVGCFGTFTAKVTFNFAIYLVDAKGKHTARVPYTLICKP